MSAWLERNISALIVGAMAALLLWGSHRNEERWKAAAAYWSNRVDLYRCADDCSGHRAGYDWASKNDIEAMDQCGGKSQSFTDGCKAYVYEQMDMDQ